MSTKLTYQKEVRKKLLAGVDKLANAVKVTLGAKGRNVCIAKEAGAVPDITKDGVTVASYIKKLEDPIEDMGAQLVKQASRKTMEYAGDGTTTSTVLAQAMIRSGIQA